jgi:hypothetical protein
MFVAQTSGGNGGANKSRGKNMDPWALIGPSKWQFSEHVGKILSDVGVAEFCQMKLENTLLCEETSFAERNLKSS